VKKVKPQFTKPCNHCGLCCQNELCEVGVIAFPGSSPPCPGLILNEDDYLCKFVLIESGNDMLPVINQSLGIGFGCSMPDETTTDSEVLSFDNWCKDQLDNNQRPPNQKLPVKIL